MRLGSKGVFGGAAAALVLLLLGVVWLGRGPVVCWWTLRGLEKAPAEERDKWAGRAADLGQDAVAPLLDLLDRGDERIGGHAGAALAQLAERWGADDARFSDLVRRLEERFPRFSPTGQREALRLGGALSSIDAARGLARLLPAAGRSPDASVRAQALELAPLLLVRSDQAEALGPCRELALAGFADADADNRARAARLALNPGMDLQRPILPLLRDPSAEVRRLAVMVVGPARDVVGTEDLLRYLHDPDAEVQRLCELALKERDLPDDHIRLGRLLTHDDPAVRLEVLDHLHRANDLDPGVWLRHLSHDKTPSVRAAAMRAATSPVYEHVRFSDRLEQMRGDPCPTVAQLAQFFLPLKKNQEGEK